MNSSENSLLTRRRKVMGESPLFYDEPLALVRGEGVHLFGTDGRRYLDCYNNIPAVGHCNSRVVDAIDRQARTLNVHSRYLDEVVVRYSERLLATFAEPFDQIIFTCTGSEANEQAIRIARMVGRGQGMICTEYAYHGNTAAVDRVSPLFHHHPQAFTNVRTITVPDAYRPMGGLTGDALVEAALARVASAIASLEEAGIGVAGMILCSVLANEGLPQVPPTFLERAAALVRQAGGLVIADEVQAGFGRTGHMWGHELMGFKPDIVTVGKPMGNGYPIAALIGKADVFDAFRKKVFYFNTFAAAQVGAAAAGAVLDVIEEQSLLENARIVGAEIRSGLADLAAECPLIGTVRGHGLWIGIELVRDRERKEPATTETRHLVNQLRRGGILLSSTGPAENVLKIRPPLIFSRDDAAELLAGLRLALQSL